MTGRLVDMAFTLGGKQRVTLEINGDFREIWDKLHQEPVLDVEIKKHREKRSLSANAYFHVLCNKISAETGESEDAVKRRLVVSYLRSAGFRIRSLLTGVRKLKSCRLL